MLTREKMKSTLNCRLVKTDVSVVEVQYVNNRFNPNTCTTHKIYEYRIMGNLGDDDENVYFRKKSCWPLKEYIDTEKLEEASK